MVTQSCHRERTSATEEEEVTAVSAGDYIKAEKDYENVIRQEISRRRGEFINGFLEKKRAEYETVERFEKAREKLQKEAEKRWQLIRDAKLKLLDLEERMKREVMKWPVMEKLYLQWLTAEGHPREVIENTVRSRQQEFERAQFRLKDKLKSQVAEQNIETVFKQRLLDPKTRQQAFQLLRDRVDKSHFLMLTLDCLFEELDKLKLKRR